MRLSLLLLSLPLPLLVGCSRTVGAGDDATDDAQVPGYEQTLPDGPCALANVTGTIPGVSLTVRSSSCVFKRGTPATFTYEVTTTAATPAITIPDSGGGCSSCRGYTTDPITFTGWIINGDSAGGEHQQYCICDVGCCAPTPEETVQVAATTSMKTIEWSGKTWSGPSDTDNPMGEFFLPGRYTVHVSFAGFDEGLVEAALPIEIIP
jgi:hypothetical protein